MLSNYSFPKTLEEAYIDLDIIGEIRPNTEYALYITCDSATTTSDCWCGFVIPDVGWSSNSVYYGDNTRYFILKTNGNVNNSKFRIQGDKGVTINHIRLIELVTNSKYSRIERFLYALYSLDSNDLPTPLSRIEELYNCWVTGANIPTFEPLSRVEKYLMAILGVYNVDSLPNPLSRVEVLLYKLAIGDDNLDDVKSFLSEHEELLAGIIRNGGAGGNIDIEYVLYTLSAEFNTLYNTAEKPVKSAILKGNTMINYAQITSYNFDEYRTPVQNLNKPIEKGKIYTIIMNIVSQTVTSGITTRFAKDNEGYKGVRTFNGVGLHKYLYTATDDFNQFAPYVNIEEYQTGLSAEYNQLMILEGDYTNTDIPYFEGMQSVKMPVLKTTGKNLCDNSKNKAIEINSTTGEEYAASRSNVVISDYIEIDPLKTYIASAVSSLELPSITFRYYNNKKEYIGFNKTNEAKYVRLRQTNQNGSLYPYDVSFQYEEGSVATEYEPYKSNILTVNEPVELREIDNVKDELNLLTGEVTQRIGEVVLDGSEKWTNNGDSNDYIAFRLEISNYQKSATIVSDSIPVIGTVNKGFGMYSGNGITVTMLKTVTSNLSNFKIWLYTNPVTIQYQLAESNVKTVDLSIVDQDGNDTELSTFNDITHVTLSSEELIPEAELEVATKNEEVLNTMSLRMDDISTTQNALQETSNAQSENVDATMIATTEIYEGLL